MPPKDAEFEAEALIWANLRGVDSHGVLRIPWYVDNVDKGAMNPKPNIQIEKETPATLLIEADHAFGPVVTIMAMNRARLLYLPVFHTSGPMDGGTQEACSGSLLVKRLGILMLWLITSC